MLAALDESVARSKMFRQNGGGADIIAAVS
jgi:hypothetical protein